MDILLHKEIEEIKSNSHCTHLQIAPADPQTEICKRVQFCLPTKAVKN